MDLDKRIARALVAAQLCSDGGKRDRRLLTKIIRFTSDDIFWKTQWNKGYSRKTFWLNRAIQMIDCSKEQDYHYWIENSPDQNGYDSVIVYFDFKIDGKRHQISFHTPKNQVKGLLEKNKSGRKTRWDKEIGGSREAAYLLFQKYFTEWGIVIDVASVIK